MPQWVYVNEIGKHEGQEVTLKGWLYNKRSSGKLHFLQLRDGTGTIQCVVFKGDVSSETFQLADRLAQESSFTVTGTVRADARSPLGFELSVKELQILQEAHDYPITPKEHGVAFLQHQVLRQVAHLQIGQVGAPHVGTLRIDRGRRRADRT